MIPYQSLFFTSNAINFPNNNNQASSEIMTANKQLVISLGKITIPSETSIKKMILSIYSSPNEYFIQSEKVVKGDKVNFYRQNIFVRQSASGLCFNVYEIDQKGQKKLKMALKVGNTDLIALMRRPTTFKIKQQGYELTFDSWIFTQNSSENDTISQRDYSELDIPFKNQQSFELVDLNMVMQVSVLRRDKENDQKRMGSNDSTSHPSPNKINCSKNNKIEMQRNQNLSPNRLRRDSIAVSSEKKKLGHIKSHLYSNIVSGLTGLISHGISS